MGAVELSYPIHSLSTNMGASNTVHSLLHKLVAIVQAAYQLKTSNTEEVSRCQSLYCVISAVDNLALQVSTFTNRSAKRNGKNNKAYFLRTSGDLCQKLHRLIIEQSEGVKRTTI